MALPPSLTAQGKLVLRLVLVPELGPSAFPIGNGDPKLIAWEEIELYLLPAMSSPEGMRSSPLAVLWRTGKPPKNSAGAILTIFPTPG